MSTESQSSRETMENSLTPSPRTANGPRSEAPTLDSQPAVRRSGKRPFLILGAVAVLVLIIIGVVKLAYAGREDTDDAQVSADIVPVGTRVAGLVKRVAVQENQQVKKGDLLVEIDDADHAARLAQAQAELATAAAQADAARAQVAVVEATSRGGLATARAAVTGSSVGVSGAAAQLGAARAALTRAEADARKADLDLARNKELRQAQAVPQERLESAQLADEAARAALAQARAQVAYAEETKRAAESRVGEARGRLSSSSPIEPQIAAARAGAELALARVAGAEAALTLARLQLSYTRVLAPSDGIASKLAVHEGQLVTPGQPVIELVPNRTYVVANFKETQVGRINVGDRAEISLDAYPGQAFQGRVESISGGTGSSFTLLPPDNATGNFVKVVQRVPVRIAWSALPGDLALRAGLSAEVTVRVGQRR
jgi:membrane fusion protein (multidrug efflux system)